VGLGESLVEADGILVGPDGLLPLSCLRIGIAELKMEQGVGWRESDCTQKGSSSIAMPSHACQRTGEIALDVAVIGFDPSCPIEELDRGLGTLGLKREDGEQMQGFRMVRLAAKNLAIGLFGRGQISTPVLLMGLCQQLVQLGAVCHRRYPGTFPTQASASSIEPAVSAGGRGGRRSSITGSPSSRAATIFP
jgi:hypothetical protein